MDKNNIDISIVIPAYNEERNIPYLYERIFGVMKPLNRNYELILIDDGSTDNTFQVISDLHFSDEKVKPVKLRRNFGKSLALAVGFREAQGNIIITLDADMQDDPDELPRFIEKIDEGWDMVSGWKKVRKDSLEKRLASRVFNVVVSKVSGLKLHDFNCGFKAYRREVLETIEVYGELHRFIPMIVHTYGFKICEIAVKHNKRQFGKSKFGKERYLAGLFDLFTMVFITGYLRKPLHFLGKISFAAFAAGISLLGYVFVMKYILGQTGDRPALTISVFLLGFSLQVLLFGLLADLLSYVNQKNNFKKQDFISRESSEKSPGLKNARRNPDFERKGSFKG